jgi:hypothetical protein
MGVHDLLAAVQANNAVRTYPEALQHGDRASGVALGALLPDLEGAALDLQLNDRADHDGHGIK